MQPLQRSYAITEERIEQMLTKGSLSFIYDEGKVFELENKLEPLTDKEKKKATIDTLQLQYFSVIYQLNQLGHIY